MTVTHPTFDAATREKRWPGQLYWALLDVLTAEAIAAPTTRGDEPLDGGWCWRVLEDGLVVSLRTRGRAEHGNHRLEVRIAAEPGAPEFDGRVSELVRGFSMRLSDGSKRCPFPGALWAKVEPQARDEGKQVARYVSLMTGETTPPQARESA